MPKRKNLHSYYRSKRRRMNPRRKFNPRNQFVNQLGGWSSNPGNTSRDIIRPFTSTRFMVNLTESRGSISVAMNSISQGIRNAFQRIRIKKVTVFIMLSDPAQSGPTTPIQFSISKLTQNDPAVDPRTVPGAQVKLMLVRSGSGTTDTYSDVIRCSRMYPPILLDTSSEVGALPTTKDNYLSTAALSAAWPCFQYDISGMTGSQTIRMDYYFTLELLCNTYKG